MERRDGDGELKKNAKNNGDRENRERKKERKRARSIVIGGLGIPGWVETCTGSFRMTFDSNSKKKIRPRDSPIVPNFCLQKSNQLRVQKNMYFEKLSAGPSDFKTGSVIFTSKDRFINQPLKKAPLARTLHNSSVQSMISFLDFRPHGN